MLRGASGLFSSPSVACLRLTVIVKNHAPSPRAPRAAGILRTPQHVEDKLLDCFSNLHLAAREEVLRVVVSVDVDNKYFAEGEGACLKCELVE